MKVCPRCNSFYADDEVFCIDDGTPLLQDASSGGRRFSVSLEDEVLTTHVAVPPRGVAAAVVPAAKPVWAYAIIGCLVGVILMGGVYVYLVTSRQSDNETAWRNTAVSNASKVSNDSSTSKNDTNIVTNGATNRVANAANTAANAMANAANAMASAANTAANKAANVARPANRGDDTYVGSVGDNSVAMELRRRGTTISGRVRPSGSSSDIFVSGTIDSNGNFWMEEKSDTGVQTGIYSGRIDDYGAMSGTWSKPNGERSRSIYLTRR